MQQKAQDEGEEKEDNEERGDVVVPVGRLKRTERVCMTLRSHGALDIEATPRYAACTRDRNCATAVRSSVGAHCTT